jgi:hypothetical protein
MSRTPVHANVVPSPAAPASPGAPLGQTLAPHHVEIPKPLEVQSYLQEHADLADLLPAICRRVREEVGEQAELSLEVYGDPETDDPYLTLYVRQAVYEPDLLTRLDRAWAPFEEPLSERSGWLLVTSDFRPPGWRHGL